MNASENMKTLLETVDNIDNDNIELSISARVNDLKQQYGKGNAKVENLINSTFRIGFERSFGHKNIPKRDIGKINELQTNHGNGNARVEEIIRLSYIAGYDHGRYI